MSTIYHRARTPWTLPVIDGPDVWIEPWCDPVVDRLDIPVRGDHTERFWLPVLGPTATWLMRHLDARLADSPEGALLEVTAAAQAIGVASTPGTKGPFARALSRCAVFGLVQPVGDKVVVRRCMPPLPARYTNRLPVAVRVAHRQWLSELSGGPRSG
jgi:hypothetical protein